MLLALALLPACGPTTGGDPSGSNAGTGGTGATAGSGGSAGSGGGSSGSSGGSATGGTAGATVAGSVGVVIVDVQETFVDGAKTPDLAGVLDRTKSVFELSGEHAIPFHVTFEASQQGDHALHAPLVPALPPQAQLFTKTTFAATGLAPFAQAIGSSGLTHLIVLGAETDVCVMQTVLGLRKLGLQVLLQTDAAFTSETNVSPALRRMQQAGVTLADHAAVSAHLADPSMLPAPSDAPVRTLDALGVGVVLHRFTDAALAQNPDPVASQKSARLRELLLVSEWFGLPVYASDGAALPAAYQSYYKAPLRPLSQLATDPPLADLVIAGTDENLAALLSSLTAHELYIMEDALFAMTGPPEPLLAPFYAAGSVPITYKSFYYEMTRSVALEEWPSPQWVAKYDEYYWITQAPEDLPPI